ncbi:hypothetical protein BC567DRAFT_292749 [Phyllosticta citribraziliensis]
MADSQDNSAISDSGTAGTNMADSQEISARPGYDTAGLDVNPVRDGTNMRAFREWEEREIDEACEEGDMAKASGFAEEALSDPALGFFYRIKYECLLCVTPGYDPWEHVKKAREVVQMAENSVMNVEEDETPNSTNVEAIRRMRAFLDEREADLLAEGQDLAVHQASKDQPDVVGGTHSILKEDTAAAHEAPMDTSVGVKVQLEEDTATRSEAPVDPNTPVSMTYSPRKLVKCSTPLRPTMVKTEDDVDIDMAAPSIEARDRNIATMDNEYVVNTEDDMEIDVAAPSIEAHDPSPVIKTQDDADVNIAPPSIIQHQMLKSHSRQSTPTESEQNTLRTAIHQDRVSKRMNSPNIPGMSGSHEKVLQWNARSQMPPPPTKSPEAPRFKKHSVLPLPKLNLTEANHGGLFPRPLTHREITPATSVASSDKSEANQSEASPMQEFVEPISPIARRPTPLSYVETVIKTEEVDEDDE